MMPRCRPAVNVNLKRRVRSRRLEKMRERRGIVENNAAASSSFLPASKTPVKVNLFLPFLQRTLGLAHICSHWITCSFSVTRLSTCHGEALTHGEHHYHSRPHTHGGLHTHGRSHTYGEIPILVFSPFLRHRSIEQLPLVSTPTYSAIYST